jgi:hypothetical protein
MKNKISKKYRLEHSDPNLNQAMQYSDVTRLAVRDYELARDRGESHADDFEFIEHRFARHNKRLIPNISIVDLMEAM